MDRPWDDTEKNKKNAICCGALLGAEKSSLPLGKETQRFFGLRFAHISNCSQKRICLARRHFWTLRWTALIFLGVLLCAFGGRKIVPASGRRKRSVFWGFVWRVVGAKVTIIENCSHKRICLARRHFRTLPWRAWPAAWALDVRFRGPKKRDCLWGRKRTFVEELAVKEHLLC